MRNHPGVHKIVQAHGIGYDDAESMLRGRKDAESVAAVKEIDAEIAAERKRAAALNADMGKRLGQGGKVSVGQLIATLAADPAAETWLLRRVNLTRAGAAPAADEHPENE